MSPGDFLKCQLMLTDFAELASCLLSPVSCLLTPVSCLFTRVSCLPVSCLLSHLEESASSPPSSRESAPSRDSDINRFDGSLFSYIFWIFRHVHNAPGISRTSGTHPADERTCEALTSPETKRNRAKIIRNQCLWKWTWTCLEMFGIIWDHQGWYLTPRDFIKLDFNKSKF